MKPSLMDPDEHADLQAILPDLFKLEARLYRMAQIIAQASHAHTKAGSLRVQHCVLFQHPLLPLDGLCLSFPLLLSLQRLLHAAGKGAEFQAFCM